MVNFQISNMSPDLIQPWIYQQLQVTEMLKLLIWLVLLKLQHVKYERFLTGFSLLFFFTNLSVIEFLVSFSDLVYHFSSTLYTTCDYASQLCKQFKLDSELEFDFQNNVFFIGSGLLILILGKLNVFHLIVIITMVL